MTFRTGLTIQAIGDFTPSNLVKLGTAIGLQHIEFDPTVFSDIENVIHVLKTKQTSIHAPYLEDYGMDLSSLNPLIDTFIENVNQWSSQLNIIGVVVHPPTDGSGNLEKFYSRLEKLKVPKLFENMPYQPWEEFINEYSNIQANIDGRLGMCFDIPHSFITNGNKFLDLPGEVISQLQSSIGYIHISGGIRDEDTHYPLLTEGDIPLEQVVTFLKTINYSGTITMELAPRNLQEVDKILHSYIMMLGIAGERRKQLYAKIKRPFIMRKINSKFKNYSIQNKDV
ncbi:MAG: sugar phosphate isomerase/epimerase family protein [Candidatus Hodarchaeales archaeon]|jgi:sugar phosphate isomerase/epimerase